MKKTKYTMLALMAGVMTFSACSNEDGLTNENNNPKAKPVYSFTAATESDGATRAAIDGLDVKWQTSDSILMMDGTNCSKYILATGEGTTSATFDKAEEATAVSGDDIYALYPCSNGSSRPAATYEEAIDAFQGASADYFVNLYKSEYEATPTPEKKNQIKGFISDQGIPQERLDIIMKYITSEQLQISAPALSGSTITNVMLPAEQSVAAGQTVDPAALLMVAKAMNDTLAFKNVCSYVKVTPTTECRKIEVIATSGEDIAGLYNVAVTATPSVAGDVAYGSNMVTLRAAEGNLAAGTTYYIAVMPGTLTTGLEIRFYTADETFSYSSRSSSFELVRNKVHNGGSNGIATGAYWSKNSGVYAWTEGDPESVKTVTVNTGVAGAMPVGATALNGDNTVWVRNDGEGNFFFETSEGRIFAKKLIATFSNCINMTSITGLGDIDVSSCDEINSCFENCNKLTSLDLSEWQITPNANTRNMFYSCLKLESLKLNNTFHAGTNMFQSVGANLATEKCAVYGVTDDNTKADLKGNNGTDTGWSHASTKIKMDGDGRTVTFVKTNWSPVSGNSISATTDGVTLTYSKTSTTFGRGANKINTAPDEQTTIGSKMIVSVSTDAGEEAVSVTFPTGGTLYSNGTNTWELTFSAEGWVYNDQVIIPTSVGYGVIIELE